MLWFFILNTLTLPWELKQLTEDGIIVLIIIFIIVLSSSSQLLIIKILSREFPNLYTLYLILLLPFDPLSCFIIFLFRMKGILRKIL